MHIINLNSYYLQVELVASTTCIIWGFERKTTHGYGRQGNIECHRIGLPDKKGVNDVMCMRMCSGYESMDRRRWNGGQVYGNLLCAYVCVCVYVFTCGSLY